MSDLEIASNNAIAITEEEIPDKLYFRIGEVARLAGIKPYVLRFWESEIPSLGPKKSGTGHRLYRRKDVQLVFEIKQLLYEKRFTIEGARKFLESRGKIEDQPKTGRQPRNANGGSSSNARVQTGLFEQPLLESIRKELQEIVKLLK